MKKLMGMAVIAAIGLSAHSQPADAEDLHCMELSGNYRGAESILLHQLHRLGTPVSPKARLQTVKLLDQLVEVEIVLNDFPKAARYQQRVIDVLSKTPHVVTMDIIGAMHRLAQIQDRALAFKQAQSSYEFERCADEALFGNQSPVSLVPLYDLAANFEAQGRLDDAEAVYQKAFEIVQNTVGANDVVLSSDWIFLGRIAAEKTHYAVAQQCYERALALLMQDPQGNASEISDVNKALSAVQKKESLLARSEGNKKL